MRYISLAELLGYANNVDINLIDFRGASNIFVSDNPEYTVEDFTSVFPLFVINQSPEAPGYIPLEVFELFKNMADASIKKERYCSAWKYFMGLYIAHMLTLYLKTSEGDPTAQNALASSISSGVATSKSVDGLSISYDLLGMAEDLAGYGTWKLTIYGQQLATLTRMYGHGGMWVNG